MSFPGLHLLSFYSADIVLGIMNQGSRTQVATPDEFDMTYEELKLRTPDNVEIRAYLMLQPGEDTYIQSRPTVLLLHANAGNVVSLWTRLGHPDSEPHSVLHSADNLLQKGHRLPIAKVFYKSMKCNVLALSYRG